MNQATKRTVLLFAPYFPPHMGGLERYAFEIAKRLNKEHSWRVVIVTSGELHGKDSKEKSQDLTVYRLGYFCKISNTPISFSWLLKIKKIIANEKPSIINIHAPVAGIGDMAALVAKNIPIVVTYHSGSMSKKKFFIDILIQLYEKLFMPFLLRRADRIVCASDFVRFHFLAKYTYKSITLTPAVDKNLFTEGGEQKSKRPTILFVAGLSKAHGHKGLQSLLDTVCLVKESIPSVQLVVVGEGDMQSTYKQRAIKLGLENTVRFIGRLEGKALADQYRNAHILVAPSTNESFSMVILEAMTSGLPVVATNIGGIPLLVSHEETGFLFTPGNQAMFVQHISTLLSDEQLRIRFGNAARAKVENSYSWESRATSYALLFNEIAPLPEMRLPHITVVAPYFYPRIGGVEYYAYNIARQFKESGKYTVSIVTSNDVGKGYKKGVVDGMTIHYLPIWKRISNTPIGLMWYFWFKRIFKSEAPDIIHMHSPVIFMADVAVFAANRRTPIVLTYHAGSMKKGKWPIDFIIGIYEKIFLPRLMERVSAIAVVSLAYAGRSFTHFKEKISLIPPGVDMSRFIATPLPKTASVLYVGRIEHSSRWKGITPLLKAFSIVQKEIPEATLTLVGDGDALEYYKNETVRQGLRWSVSFVGVKTGEDLASYYQQTKIVVLPSTSSAESFGMTLIEGMASGRPVIGSQIGGIPEVIIDNITGLLVEANNPEALAGAIVRVLKDTLLAERYGDAGVKRAREFTWKIQADKYEKLFQQLLSKKPTIAQIVGYYPPHTGGMEMVAKEISELLAVKGFEVRVFTSRFGAKDSLRDERSTNIIIRRLRGIELAHTPLLFSLPLHLLGLPRASVMHVHIAQAGIPEISALIAHIRGFRIIGHFHLDIGPSGKLGILLPFYKKFILGPTLRSYDKIIVFSVDQKNLLIKRYCIDSERIVIISNGVGAEYFHQKTTTEETEILQLLFVGRLATQKKVERLIDMLPLVTVPCHLTIVGDGDERVAFELRAKNLRLNNITFTGKKSGAELVEAYSKADVFLISSDVEGMPLVVLEAMASGLPIIATDVLGLRELVKGVGVLVDIPYEDNFAVAINELYHDKYRRALLAKQSYEKALLFTWETAVERLICYL